MAPRRVLVGQLPPILADLVRQLLNEVAEVTTSSATETDDLVAAAVKARAHVVVTLLDSEVAASELSLLLGRQLHDVVVVALDRRGRMAVRYVGGSAQTVSHDLSPSTLRQLLDAPGSAT